MNGEKLDIAGVKAKFGVAPERIVDYLALIGDSVDNVPGVAKVGPKTAVKWLDAWGSLDAIVAHAAEIGGAVGENLRQHLDFLPLGVKLVTVACELPLPVAIDELAPQAPDTARLEELYARLEFKGWLRELKGEAPAPAAAESRRWRQRRLLKCRRRRARPQRLPVHPRRGPCRTGWRASTPRRWSRSTPRPPTSTRCRRGWSASRSPSKAARPPTCRWATTMPARRSSCRWRATLAKLDPGWSRRATASSASTSSTTATSSPTTACGCRHRRGHAAAILRARVGQGPRPRRAGGCAIAACPPSVTTRSPARAPAAFPSPRSTSRAPPNIRPRMPMSRCACIRRLRPQLAAAPELEALYRDLELPVAEVLFRMERNGVLIDADALARQSEELGRKIMAIEAEAQQLAGQPFNLASPKQLAEILFNQQGLPVVKKTPSGAPSTDEEVLEKLAEDYPLPKKILEHRSFAKLKNTYTDKLPKMINPATGRVHTSFGQATAVTGRLASTDPNLQNIPIRTAEGRRIRSAFIAPENRRIVSADYSQIELRIMAHLSDDPRLLEAFAAGEDVHRATAGEVFGLTPIEVSSEQRRAAKAINFGLIYGMSAFGLAKQIGVDRTAAQAYMDRYFARYPGVARYMEETRAVAREKGYVETVFGRRLWLPEIRSSNAGRRQGAERAAINAPMQGTAADLIKRAMLAVQGWLDAQLKSLLMLQVHDELVLEVPVDELDPTARGAAEADGRRGGSRCRCWWKWVWAPTAEFAFERRLCFARQLKIAKWDQENARRRQ
jgi:DNA polymerase-1